MRLGNSYFTLLQDCETDVSECQLFRRSEACEPQWKLSNPVPIIPDLFLACKYGGYNPRKPSSDGWTVAKGSALASVALV